MSAVEGAFLLVLVAVIVRVTPAAVGWAAGRLADRDLRRAELELEGAYLSAIPAEHAGTDTDAVRHVNLELGSSS